MIAHLRGSVIEETLGSIVVEVGGVGYEVRVPAGTAGRLERSGEGDQVRVHVHTSVREDAIELYGFATRDERAVFARLISVSGVGPKLAVSILGALTPSELVIAVESNDIAALVRVPGVGKKKAQKLILDLKSRFDAIALDAIAPAGSGVSIVEDLRSALTNLGFAPALVEDAVGQLAPRASEFDDAEAMLREAFALLR